MTLAYILPSSVIPNLVFEFRGRKAITEVGTETRICHGRQKNWGSITGRDKVSISSP
jgi:hypothetical protein